MKPRSLALLALALLLAAGCRTDPRVSALERECRLQEDRIYELEDLLAKCEQALDASGGAATGPSASAAAQPAGSPAPVVLEPSGGSTAPRAKAPDRPEALRPKPPGTLDLPKVEFPTESVPPGQIPPRLRPGPGARPPAETGPSPSEPRSQPGRGAAPTGTWHIGTGDTRVAAITLNATFTGGYNADGQPGDEGITAAIEPRDAQGRLVPVAAPVSVVVVDPAQSGEAARVARWDFSTEQITAMAQTTRLSEGIHLALTWPDKAPAHSQLRLFVRYTTSDGRKLQAEQPIDVDLPGRQARHWTQATSGEPPAPSGSAMVPAASSPARVAARPAAAEPSPPKRRRPAWSPDRY